jgi:AraC family transcriptional regulator
MEHAVLDHFPGSTHTINAMIWCWDGAAVIDLLCGEQGQIEHEHRALMLQRWCAPLEVRVHGQAGWQRFQPEARLWLPGDEQCNEWRGAVRNQVVVMALPAVEQLLERPFHATQLARWRGRHFDTEALALVLHTLYVAAARHEPLQSEGLLVALIDRLAAGPDAVPASRSERLSPPRLAALKEHIEAHLTEPLSLRGLAAAAGCSPRLVGAMFKAATGRSPYQYVLERRVSEAQRLLRRREHPLCEVAQRAGFTDQSQFSRTFRRLTGVTPGEFQRRRASHIVSRAMSAA